MLLPPRVLWGPLAHGSLPPGSFVGLPPARFVRVLVADTRVWVVFPPVVSLSVFWLPCVCALVPLPPPALRGAPRSASPRPWPAIAFRPARDRSFSSVPIPIPRFYDLCIRLPSKTAFGTRPHWLPFHPDPSRPLPFLHTLFPNASARFRSSAPHARSILLCPSSPDHASSLAAPSG